MRLILCCTALWAGVAFTSATGQEPARAVELKDVLPKDEAAVAVMQIGASPRIALLTKKLQEAAAEDPDWWQAHVKKAKPGEPLPYDPKIGLSKEEYQEYLDLAKTLGLTKLKTVKVRVKQDGRLVILTFGDDLPALKEAVINLKDDSVTTPYGVAATRSVIKAAPGQKATGPWNGIQWKLENVDLATGKGTIVKFAIGKLKDTDRGIIYYDVKQVTDDSRTFLHYVLFYDLNAAR